MTKFVAILNDGSFINIEATGMELVENAIRVWNGPNLVAYIDTSTILTPHISGRKEQPNEYDQRNPIYHDHP